MIDNIGGNQKQAKAKDSNTTQIIIILIIDQFQYKL